MRGETKSEAPHEPYPVAVTAQNRVPASTRPTSASVQKTQPASQDSSNTPNQAADNPLDIDWGTLGLALLAILAVGGLIPFWVWIYYIYNPPLLK
jgi:hypothetical protein